MAYIINKSNDVELVTIPDGTSDTSATNLELIGRNFTGYGEAIAENFVRLLENSASNIKPNTPMTGELWYDTSNDVLNVNVSATGNDWKPIAVSSISLAAEIPLDPRTGDMWYTTDVGQLAVYDGADFVVIGPLTTPAILDAKVDDTGDTMTGPLILPADLTPAANQAVTPEYVAQEVISGQVDISGKVDLTGGTMQGMLYLFADPTNAMHAATQQYVIEKAGERLLVTGDAMEGHLTLVSDPPADDSGLLVATPRQYVNDQDDLRLPLTGGDLSSFLTLHQDPTNALHAATKNYVDSTLIDGGSF